MKTISKRQRSMLPRTAFVLIVIGIAYITIPDKLSFSLRHSSAFSSKEDDLSFSTRQLLQAENSDETITDNSESDSRYSLFYFYFFSKLDVEKVDFPANSCEKYHSELEIGF